MNAIGQRRLPICITSWVGSVERGRHCLLHI